MAALEVGDDPEFARQPRRAGGRGGAQEGGGHRTQGQEGELGRGPWAEGPGGPPCWASVVGVEEAHLAGAHEPMSGDVAVPMADDELGTLDADLDAPADEGSRHAVPRGAEAHGAQRVDDAALRGSRGRAQGGQRPQQRALGREALDGDRAGLAVDSAVDLATPGRGGRVRGGQVSEGPETHRGKVGLGIAHEVLDEALGLGVTGLTEVGGEAVVGREGDVARGGHDDVGHDTAPKTAHAVGEHDGGHPAERLEALREQAQRGGLVLPLR